MCLTFNIVMSNYFWNGFCRFGIPRVEIGIFDISLHFLKLFLTFATFGWCVYCEHFRLKQRFYWLFRNFPNIENPFRRIGLRFRRVERFVRDIENGFRGVERAFRDLEWSFRGVKTVCRDIERVVRRLERGF